MTYLVVNPTAGRGRARQSFETVRTFFERKDWALTPFFTEHPEQATDYVKTLPPNATVIVLGGDGTLHEVAAACVHTERVLGVLPAGSGDDFAYALGIPRNDLGAALRIIEQAVGEKRTRRVDTGRVNDTIFINAFGVGFDADVAYGLKRAPAFLRDKAAYYYTILTTLGRLETSPVTATLDGETIFQGSALLISSQNGPRTGGSFLFAPEAKLDDGLLDVVIAGSLGRLETVQLLPKVAKGNHLSHPKVFAFKGRELTLRWDGARPGHKEGEVLAPTTSFHIQIQPRSLNVLAPAP